MNNYPSSEPRVYNQPLLVQYGDEFILEQGSNGAEVFFDGASHDDMARALDPKDPSNEGYVVAVETRGSNGYGRTYVYSPNVTNDTACVLDTNPDGTISDYRVVNAPKLRDAFAESPVIIGQPDDRFANRVVERVSTNYIPYGITDGMAELAPRGEISTLQVAIGYLQSHAQA